METSPKQPPMSAIEHLVSGSQGVLSKRVDLAVLEGREILTHALYALALLCLSVLLVAVAWMSIAAAIVLWVLPEADRLIQLGAFAVLNGAAAVGGVALALRQSRAPQPPQPAQSIDGGSPQAAPGD